MASSGPPLGSEARPIRILLVEDDPGDEVLTTRALETGPFRTDCRVVRDGEEALEYLRRRGRWAEPGAAPRPDLVLLDLNLPRVDGREVLREIRADESLRRLIVVVLTTSRLEEDVRRVYDCGANSYIAKPVDPRDFAEAVQKLERYWFETVTLPEA